MIRWESTTADSRQTKDQMNSYKQPRCPATAEFIEKKSRFIGHISPIGSEDEALAFVRSIREKHREATHNVYAYRLIDNSICRHSDDGEPSGTAGMPLLDVFVKQEIFNFCCVATRYFGGVLLGAGGLVRAYARCGAEALAASGIIEMREMLLCSVSLPYALYEPVRRLITECRAAIDTTNFGTEIDVGFSIAEEDLPALRSKLDELTAGAISISPGRSVFQAREISATPRRL